MFWSALFLAGLCAASSLAMFSGYSGLRRTAFVMLANWCACMFAVLFAGTLTPWALFMLFDAASAYAVVRSPASRPQAVIGAIYIFQIAFHVAFAVVGNSAATSIYLDLLALAGWGQIATLAGGAIYGGGRKIYDSFRGGRDFRHPHSKNR